MRSDWDIVKVKDNKVYIEDLNLGRMSVTNDAENIFECIQKHYPDHRLIYRDSEGQWDEIYLEKTWLGSSISFKPYTGE